MQEMQKKMQDPVVMAQMQDAQNKQAEIQRKTAKDQADQMARQGQQQIEIERIRSQERIAGMNAGIKSVANQQEMEQKRDVDNARIKLDAIKAGADLARGK
jgi:hypothetical protein